MMCPRCQDDDISTIETTKKESVISRVRKCRNCNFIFYTEEQIKFVSVFNHIKRKAFRMPVREYQDKKLWDVCRELS